MKFGRDYILTVGVGPYAPPVKTGGASLFTQTTTRSITIKPPLTLEFMVRRDFLASAQTATLRIKNLAEDTRNMIYKDRYAFAKYAPIRLQAGYKNNYLPQIFIGSIWYAQSRREGQENIVTEIESFDGGFAQTNSYSSFSLPSQHPFTDAITRLNGDLLTTSNTPIIGTVPSILGPRPTVFVGPTFRLIQNLLPPGVRATIDNNQLKVLADTDTIPIADLDDLIISNDTGLLEPPVREEQCVMCKILFEPRLIVGQRVLLVSKDNSKYNGYYRVNGITHQGIISDSENGPAVTTVQLYNQGLLNALI